MRKKVSVLLSLLWLVSVAPLLPLVLSLHGHHSIEAHFEGANLKFAFHHDEDSDHHHGSDSNEGDHSTDSDTHEVLLPASTTSPQQILISAPELQPVLLQFVELISSDFFSKGFAHEMDNVHTLDAIALSNLRARSSVLLLI